MSNVEHRPVIKFFIWKDLNATEISKELENVYRDDAPSYGILAKWVAESKESEYAFKDSARTGRPSTIITDQNIQAVERIVMRDR